MSSVLVRSSLLAVISLLGSNDSLLGGVKAVPCIRALASHCLVKQLLGLTSELLQLSSCRSCRGMGSGH